MGGIGVGATRWNKVCEKSLKVADRKQRVCSKRSSAWEFLVVSAAATQRTNMRVPFNLTDDVSHELVTGPGAEIKMINDKTQLTISADDASHPRFPQQTDHIRTETLRQGYQCRCITLWVGGD